MFCIMTGVYITQVSAFIRIHPVIHVRLCILSIPKFSLKKEPETSTELWLMICRLKYLSIEYTHGYILLGNASGKKMGQWAEESWIDGVDGWICDEANSSMLTE